MTELDATSSHLYPGARLTLQAGGTGAVVIRFADGSSASARIGGDRLSVAPYRTRAGTRIDGKDWRISVEGAEVRVLARR